MKKYILDTCILLNDPLSFTKFKDNEVIIPLAVFDDLDRRKTDLGQVGWAARESIRQIKSFGIEDCLKESGVVVNEDNGKFFIYNPEKLDKNTVDINTGNSDNALILAAMNLNAILVTEDVALHIRAVAYGCEVTSVKAENENFLFQGVRYIEINNSKDWAVVWESENIFPKSLGLEGLEGIAPNEYVVFKWGESLCPYIYIKDTLVKLTFKDKYGKDQMFMASRPKNLEQKMACHLLNNDEIKMVSVSGRAGCGKSYLALAVGLQKMMDGVYDKILILKPTNAVGGRDIGALPGDKFEKLLSWFANFKDNCDQLLVPGKKKGKTDDAWGSFEEMCREGFIECEAMTYIQGRSVVNTFIIIDEAENITVREARMLAERVGENSKIAFLGDISQIENRNVDKRNNGLTAAINGGVGHELCASIVLTKVERSSLAAIASEIFGVS